MSKTGSSKNEMNVIAATQAMVEKERDISNIFK